MTTGKGQSVSEHKHRLPHNGSTVGDETSNMISACCMKALANRSCHLLSYVRTGTAPPCACCPQMVPRDTVFKTWKFREVTKFAFVTN